MRSLPIAGDVRLSEGLVAGSEEILTEVYDTYSPIVYGMALHMTRDRGAAEEITQDVFVDLWQRPERFDPHRAPLGGWLSMIARRRGIDWVRRRRTQEKALVTVAAGEPEPHVEDAVLVSDTYTHVRRVVAELPAPHRQAVLLAYFDGLTYREVARTLNIPESTAKWRLRNALRRIGERLTAEGLRHE